MTTHRFVAQVRRALDLDTDHQAMEWAGEAVGAYLAAIQDEALLSQVMADLPDRLVEMAGKSRASFGAVAPTPASLAEDLHCPDQVADHLLRVVWTFLTDLLSPADVTLVRLAFPRYLVERLDQYELEAEDEKDVLHGDVAIYMYSESPPAGAVLSGGDVDAAWQEAESSGEEAVGGSVITPDQDVVEEIGEALGVTYRFDESLRPVDKEASRDLDRWEMNPASAEDYRSRNHPVKRRGSR